MKKLIAPFLVLFLVTGCPLLTTSEAPAPRTAKEQLIVAEYSWQAAMRTLQHMMIIGLVNSENGPAINAVMLQASAAMDVARSAVLENADGALLKVQFANRLVTNFILALDREKK